jgi:hypothetical protein
MDKLIPAWAFAQGAGANYPVYLQFIFARKKPLF